MFNDHAAGALKVERALHEGFFRDFGLTPGDGRGDAARADDAGVHDYLLAVAYGRPFHEALAALLPCYWIYWEVGKELERGGLADPSTRAGSAPTRSEEFGSVVRAVLDATDEIGRRRSATPSAPRCAATS